MAEKSLGAKLDVLVLGGGIHGVGVLHDLIARGITNVELLEKNQIGSGTSSKSTKLIHGGLRYLQNISQFPMVKESLNERRFLLDIAPEIVQPIRFILPLDHSFAHQMFLRTGLFFYDCLAGRDKIHSHKSIEKSEVSKLAPVLDQSSFKHYVQFWDGQTDDLALVHKIAQSATEHHGTIREGCQAETIRSTDEGFLVGYKNAQGEFTEVHTHYVINCLGPWANRFLEQNRIVPEYEALNNKGIHLIFPDMGLKAGVFLFSFSDQRAIFILPWLGKTLVGTTEKAYSADLDNIPVDEEEIDYLLTHCNKILNPPLQKNQILETFAGLRWLAVNKNKSLSATPREVSLGMNRGKSGYIQTIYGGKLTSYRLLAKKIGDQLCQDMQRDLPCQTQLKEHWTKQPIKSNDPVERFR